MQAWEEKYYEREEGRLEGQREMLKLMEEKLAEGRESLEIAKALEELRGLAKKLERTEETEEQKRV